MTDTSTHGPYEVDADTLERYGTLEPSDLGRWYILVNGAMQFVEHDDDDDNSPPDVADDDYTISDARGGGYHVNRLGDFPDYDAAIAAIQADMEASQFWPNVWQVNDHGNIDLLAIDASGATSIVQSWA